MPRYKILIDETDDVVRVTAFLVHANNLSIVVDTDHEPPQIHFADEGQQLSYFLTAPLEVIE